MSTSRTTDMGDYVLVESGEPTVENPTIWHSADVQWKSGTEQANHQSIQRAAQTALNANRVFLALATPTQAQNLAHIQALTRQNQGIIRLLLQQFDGTN
jgi:hypothetical protein